ncbi:MAG: (p)ppGpp synthetase [Pseudomonadota bacterium]
MNEKEFKEKWELDKPIYSAWGDYIVNSITNELIKRGKNIEVFLKTPAKFRLKDDASLIDKAFYRPGKNYTNPYGQIEDKVGARFIVLLLDDIREMCNVIQSNDDWSFDACKHFDDDKEKNPLLFTYQSVHYILHPKKEVTINSITVPVSTSCEVQIRTLLQHAHAELTHDAIYKAKRAVKPNVHRTVAKSMALIETTDDFFTAVTQQLNHGPLEDHGILERLDGLYLSLTGIKSHTQKSSILIWDQFEQFIDENLVDNIQRLISSSDYNFLPDMIKKQYVDNAFYQQSTVLFIYWMLKNRKQRLLKDWPFQQELLQPLALDIGVNTYDD